MQAVQQQKEQREAQSRLSEPSTSPASDSEAQRRQKALGPSIQHQRSSSHSPEHARQHEPQDHPRSVPSHPDSPTVALEHVDRSRSRGRRRRFGDFMRLVWVDWLFIIGVLLLSAALGLWMPMYRKDYRIIPLWYDPVKKSWYGPVSISCRKNGWPSVISSTVTGFVLVFVPLAVILFLQLWTKSFWDAYMAKIGVIKALSLMTIFQQVFKRFVGEERPYFMEVCIPKIPSSFSGSPYSPTWWKIRDICRDIPPNAWQSFPSGHTGSAFASATYLALYLNAKFKSFSNYQTSFWKTLCVVTPLFGAGLIGTGMIIDCVSFHPASTFKLIREASDPSRTVADQPTQSHHTHDVIMSMFIGIFFGFLAYRAQFHSVLDYRNNHIPLPLRGQTLSFKPTDASINAAAEPTENYKGDGEIAHGPNSSRPDRHLPVSWPLSLDEKRGARTNKRRGHPSGPDAIPEEKQASDVRSGDARMALDGNSSVNGVISTRFRSSTEQGSVIHHRPTGGDGPSSSRRIQPTTDAASVRDRELIGSGVGSEVANMV
ncbi:MAG: hypothetical protein Q9195_001894 [Heterodermia aff. obscurata]